MTIDEPGREASITGTLWVTWGQFQIADGENWPTKPRGVV